MKNYIVREGRCVIKTTPCLQEALKAFEETLIRDYDSFGFGSLMRLTLERYNSKNGWHVLVLGTEFGLITSNYTSDFVMSIQSEMTLKAIKIFSQTSKNALDFK